MTPAYIYGLFLTISLAVASSQVEGSTRSALLIGALCSLISMILTAVVDGVSERARAKALKNEPWGPRT